MRTNVSGSSGHQNHEFLGLVCRVNTITPQSISDSSFERSRRRKSRAKRMRAYLIGSSQTFIAPSTKFGLLHDLPALAGLSAVLRLAVTAVEARGTERLRADLLARRSGARTSGKTG